MDPFVLRAVLFIIGDILNTWSIFVQLWEKSCLSSSWWLTGVFSSLGQRLGICKNTFSLFHFYEMFDFSFDGVNWEIKTQERR
jgi:hypothetical protein